MNATELILTITAGITAIGWGLFAFKQVHLMKLHKARSRYQASSLRFHEILEQGSSISFLIPSEYIQHQVSNIEKEDCQDSAIIRIHSNDEVSFDIKHNQIMTVQ